MLEELIRALNEKRVRARGALAEIAGLYGGEGMHPASQHGQHVAVSDNLTQMLGKVLPPQLAANTADLGGFVNESISGALQSALGNNFQSDTGFDWADISSNREGQDQALANMPEPSILMRAAQDSTGLGLAEQLSTFLSGSQSREAKYAEKLKKMSPAERMVFVLSGG